MAPRRAILAAFSAHTACVDGPLILQAVFPTNDKPNDVKHGPEQEQRIRSLWYFLATLEESWIPGEEEKSRDRDSQRHEIPIKKKGRNYC